MSSQVYKQDFSSEVFFRSEPDAGGNVCSPIATVFQSASFISALEELALQAEVVRARQMLVTQPITKTQGAQNLDPANLFFDSESRAVQASATAEDDAAVAQNLALQATSLGLGATFVGAFEADQVKAAIASRDEGEVPLLMMAVGVPKGSHREHHGGDGVVPFEDT